LVGEQRGEIGERTRRLGRGIRCGGLFDGRKDVARETGEERRELASAVEDSARTHEVEDGAFLKTLLKLARDRCDIETRRWCVHFAECADDPISRSALAAKGIDYLVAQTRREIAAAIG
jgi:hypothetical protein